MSAGPSDLGNAIRIVARISISDNRRPVLSDGPRWRIWNGRNWA